VCIDTGAILLTDPITHREETGAWYEEQSAWLREQVDEQGYLRETATSDSEHSRDARAARGERSVQVAHAPNGQGAALEVDTGYGDSFYPVYGLMNADGRIIRIEIETAGLDALLLEHQRGDGP
jgi:hypothetical protein